MVLLDLAIQLASEQGLGIASVPGKQASPQSQGGHLVDPPDLRQPALSVLAGRLIAQAELVLPSDQISCVSGKLIVKPRSLLGT